MMELKDNSQKIVDKYVKKYPDKIKSYIKRKWWTRFCKKLWIRKKQMENILAMLIVMILLKKDMYKKLYNKAKRK